MRLSTGPGRERWLEVARACEYATFFHTPIWHELFTAHDRSTRDCSVEIALSSGTRAILPLLRARGFGPLNDLYSSGAMCYGGLIADGPISAEEVRSIYRAVCNWRVLRLQLLDNPLAGHRDVQLMPGAAVRNDTTHILNLTGDFDQIYGNFSKGHRTNYTKGVRKGVRVRLATSLADYKAYYNAYLDSNRRWAEEGRADPKSHTFWELFRVMHSFATRYPEQIQLWVATVDDLIVSGALVFYWNRHAVYWHGATLEEYFEYRPSVVLHTELIRNAVERGFAYYDFNPSGINPGVAEFKRRFGAEEVPLQRSLYGDEKFQLLRNLRVQVGALRRRRQATA